jgi:hypothetical protein
MVAVLPSFTSKFQIEREWKEKACLYCPGKKKKKVSRDFTYVPLARTVAHGSFSLREAQGSKYC